MKTIIMLFILLWSILIMTSPADAEDLPSHHTMDGFRNPHDNPSDRFSDFLRWRLGLGPEEAPAFSPKDIPPYEPEIVEPDIDRINRPDPDQIQITWIGHSTVLIQTQGVNILTDPMFSKRASPFSFAGPKRLAPPGLSLDKLPEVHVAVISHNHYDHLDLSTVKCLGNRTKFIVPMGLASWFEEQGITNVIELDWWQSTEYRGIVFDSVPLQHFSARNTGDRNKTLWSGWILEGKAGRVFFAGDTGYSPLFKEIGKRYNSIKVSLIPIGAYMPRWFMKPVHVNPPEAVKIHQDVGSERSIAIHWGTFKLTDEPPGEPPIYLRKALKDAGIGEEKFIIMRFGETITAK